MTSQIYTVFHGKEQVILVTCSQKQQAIELLSATPSKEALLTLISWLDVACAEAPLTSLPRQILARAVVAVGYVLYEKFGYETIAQTIQAAEGFALAPTLDNFAAYQNAATNSYPFGPGDGCYAIAATGYAGCEPGSGCRSGAGCLYLVELGEIVVMETVAKDLLPWLQREDDPIGKTC